MLYDSSLTRWVMDIYWIGTPAYWVWELPRLKYILTPHNVLPNYPSTLPHTHLGTRPNYISLPEGWEGFFKPLHDLEHLPPTLYLSSRQILGFGPVDPNYPRRIEVYHSIMCCSEPEKILPWTLQSSLIPRPSISFVQLPPCGHILNIDICEIKIERHGLG